MKETSRHEVVVDGHVGVLSFGYDDANLEVWVNIQDIEAGTQVEARLGARDAKKLWKSNGFSQACIACFHDVMARVSKGLYKTKE